MPSKDGSQRETYLGNGVTRVNGTCISFFWRQIVNFTVKLTNRHYNTKKPDSKL